MNHTEGEVRLVLCCALRSLHYGSYHLTVNCPPTAEGGPAKAKVKITVRLPWYERWKKLMGWYFKIELRQHVLYWLSTELDLGWIAADVEIELQ